MSIIPKSRWVSFFLTLLFGPLGLLYSTIVGSLILLVITFVSLPTVIGPIFCWILAIAIGDHATHKHNKAIEEFKAAVSKG